MRDPNRAVPILFVAALFFYFYSESLLRQAAVGKLSPAKFNPDTVISKLPAGMRVSAKKKYDIAKLRDAVLSARSDAEKISALSNLAFAVESQKEKDKLFREVLKLPPCPEAAHAYSYFLLNQKSSNPIPAREYHVFIAKCPETARLSLWTTGLSSLRAGNNAPDEQLDFLKPLLDSEPPYREYIGLYERIAELAFTSGRGDILERAGKMQEKCAERPLLEDELMKDEIRRK